MKTLWESQRKQQKELGLDPSYMDEVQKRQVAADHMLLLFEEVAELQRSTAHYKKHILVHKINEGNVVSDVVDVLKVTLAIAQLHGISFDRVYEEFLNKTKVVKARAEFNRQDFVTNTKVLCVDLDDVICNCEPWVKELIRRHGTTEASSAKWLGMEEAWKEDFYNKGFFGKLEPIEGAPQALKEIHSWGFKVVVATARPQWQFKRIYSDTLNWLQRCEIPHDAILFGKDKVELIYQNILPAWPVAFIDDREKNALALSDAGVNVLLFDTQRNRGLIEKTNIKRVHGWTDVLKEVEKYK